MKIVIVENPRPLTMEHYNDVANAPLSASLNSGYALAVARLAGWEAAHLDFGTAAGDAAAMAAAIVAEEGDLVLFHWVYSWGNEEIVRETMAMLRRLTAAPVGAFGLFPTLARDRLFSYALMLDFILAGEFEETLADLLTSFRDQRSVAALPGVAMRGERLEPRPLISDISRLPIPDDAGANCGYPSLNVAASRGCFGDCTFCFIRPYYGCSRRRVRTTASLEQELEARLGRREIRSLYFIDPTFIGHGDGERERVVAIGIMARRLGLRFGFETRVDTVDAELMETLAADGAESVFLGIESGCDSVLQRIGKRIDTEQIRRAVRIVRGSGLRLHVGFIMFEPDSTLEELADNYRFLEELHLLDHHDLTANLLYHNQIVLNGSAAWGRFEREGRLLLDERLPFEARYRFRDARVGRVCFAMGRLASGYFRGIDALRRAGRTGREDCRGPAPAWRRDFSAADVNALLKEAFLAFCSAAGDVSVTNMARLEARYTEQMKQALALQPAASP